jgi:hypothetical protein
MIEHIASTYHFFKINPPTKRAIHFHIIPVRK